MASDSDSESSYFQPSTSGDHSWANYILQLLAIGLAVLFGVYTAISYPLTKGALQQAEIANQLSLLSFCSAQAENSSWIASCATVLENFDLTAIAVVLVPSPSSPTTPGGSHGNGGLSSAQKIALGVGLGFELPAVLVTTFVFIVKTGFNMLLAMLGISTRNRRPRVEVVEERYSRTPSVAVASPK